MTEEFPDVEQMHMIVTEHLIYDPWFGSVWDRSKTMTYRGRTMITGFLGYLVHGPELPISCEIADQWRQLQEWARKPQTTE